MADIVLVEGNNELNVAMTPGVPVKGTIWGFVTDSLTGEAVPDVKITLDGLVRYTSWVGQYEFRDLDYRQYQMEFSKEGYETVTRYATPNTQLNVSLPLILPTKPELIYAIPAEKQVGSGETAHINYKVSIPDIPAQNTLIFLFTLEGVRCWTPYGCASVTFRAGAKAGYYEDSAAWYAKYMIDHFQFENVPLGTYRLLSSCELYRDDTLLKTYWADVDTGETIEIVEAPPVGPDIEVHYLKVEPTEISVGDIVEITAAMRNVGEAAGTGTLEVTVNGISLGTRTATLNPGQYQGWLFSYTPEEAGTYQVEADGLTKSFTAYAIGLKDLVIEPDYVTVGEEVSISVTAVNSGNTAGSHRIVFDIDGQEMSEMVTLAPGASELVTIKITPGEARRYLVSVDGLYGWLEAVEPYPDIASPEIVSIEWVLPFDKYLEPGFRGTILLPAPGKNQYYLLFHNLGGIELNTRIENYLGNGLWAFGGRAQLPFANYPNKFECPPGGYGQPGFYYSRIPCIGTVLTLNLRVELWEPYTVGIYTSARKLKGWKLDSGLTFVVDRRM